MLTANQRPKDNGGGSGSCKGESSDKISAHYHPVFVLEISGF